MRPFLLGQREAKFFNYGIGQHFSGNALDLGLRRFARESSVQRELKILSLANALQTFVTHLLEGALDGLALGVKNAFLERDVDVGCHKRFIIREQVRVRRPQSDLGFSGFRPLDPKTWVASLCLFFQLLIEIGQGVFEEFAMPRIGACFQLL